MSKLDFAGQVAPFLEENGLDGWLLYDYHASNPIFWEVVGGRRFVTRPCLLYIPAKAEPALVAHAVDEGKLKDTGIAVKVYATHTAKVAALKELLQGAKKVAMEYSPLGALPVISRVDAGTVEMVRSLGVEVVSSADVVQFALGRLDQDEYLSHLSAAASLSIIVRQAFAYIAEAPRSEWDVHQFIRERYREQGLIADEGPVVAVNEHSSDPHYEPSAASPSAQGRPIVPGDWVLLDLWAKEQGGVFADITWVGHYGQPPLKNRQVFAVVAGARDLAVEFLRKSYQRGYTPQGCQVDQVARDYITAAGYGPYFTHRLGHSLGAEVHAYSANLDDFETHDTRPLIPDLAFTIEPGIYIPEFGMRSEIDVVMTPKGPKVTTEVQRAIYPIGPGKAENRPRPPTSRGGHAPLSPGQGA